MKIPFVDLKAQYNDIRIPLERAIKSSINEFYFVRGKSVKQFEDSFARMIGVKHCIATSNGTTSLFVALKSLGIKEGDEVITPSFTWISSSETISLCHATPIFADVDPQTYTLTPALIEKCISPRTKAVVVVHLYGQAAPMKEIRALCKKHNLFLIEDCAQAHLTEENGKFAGSLGDVSAFSFYPTKNLGAFGDAGCIVTNDRQRAEWIRRFTNHGALQKDDHEIEGINSRMDTLQAAVLNVKLKYLERWNKKRMRNASLYKSLLKNTGDIILPHQRPGTKHTYHLFVIRTQHRDSLKEFLLSRGIQTMVHYPQALTNTNAYQYLHSNPNDFPVSNALEKEVLSLPVYPELTKDQIMFICRNIRLFYKKVKSV
jgi:dTDP-4-amino-4,6-dideoxygalactose transaminase